jgi:putative oxidoreductase
MKFLSSLGRFIYAIPFILFGVFHFMNGHAMAQMVLKGWPIADGLVYVAGLGMILAGVSIIINVKARLACLLLAMLLLIFILALHLPNLLAGDASGISMVSLLKNSAMASLLKDTALLGAALTYAGILKN